MYPNIYSRAERCTNNAKKFVATIKIRQISATLCNKTYLAEMKIRKKNQHVRTLQLENKR